MEFIITNVARDELIKQYNKKKIRIKPKIKTWAGITYTIVQDEQKADDILYTVEEFNFIINKDEEKEVSYIEIDYLKDWSGEDFIITAGF